MIKKKKRKEKRNTTIIYNFFSYHKPDANRDPSNNANHICRNTESGLSYRNDLSAFLLKSNKKNLKKVGVQR